MCGLIIDLQNNSEPPLDSCGLIAQSMIFFGVTQLGELFKILLKNLSLSDTLSATTR